MNKLVASIVSLLCFALAAPAHAQFDEEEKSLSSPQWFMYELKFGPYLPQVDKEFSNVADPPFKHIFGESKGLMITNELDLEVWRGFGIVAVGGSIGYYNKSHTAEQDNSSDDKTPASSNTWLSGETSISLMPLSLLGIYRFDVLFTRFNVPLIPYAKFGLNYTLWWINQPSGDTAVFEGKSGSGGTFGWQFQAGVAFLMDVLEPQAAKNMDVELGVNHSYLFFEFARIAADGFGSDKALIVGDTTWNAGIAFAF